MPARTVRTVWKGDQRTGYGQLELGDLKIGLVELVRSTPGVHRASFPPRPATGDENDSPQSAGADALIAAASPDELITASYAASFTMQLLAEVSDAGGTSQALEVCADASFEPDHTDPTQPGRISLAVHGEVAGLNAQAFAAAASAARAHCPIGRALDGIDIALATMLG